MKHRPLGTVPPDFTLDDGPALFDSSAPSASLRTAAAAEPWLARAGRILSLWIVAPVLFLFLMYDKSLLKRGILRMIPNSYFLPTLNVLSEIHDAFAAYLRGIAMQVGLVSATLLTLFVAGGMPLGVALTLALSAGIANIVPFFGPLVGLPLALVYALVAEDLAPLLPFVTQANFPVWVLVSFAITQVLDNTVYQPFVVGGTVAPHPLVIILGLLAASYLFGAVGLLFAVPAIVLAKVVASSVHSQLSAFRLI